MSHVTARELLGEGVPVSWRDQSVCRDLDPSVFFPVGTTGPAVGQIATAKAICRTCPVRVECLEFAIATKQDFGVWGGYDEEERRGMRRRLRAVQAAARAGQEMAVFPPGVELVPFEVPNPFAPTKVVAEMPLDESPSCGAMASADIERARNFS